MEAATEVLTPLYQCLDLEVDLERSVLRGRTSLWLRHFPSSYGRYDTYPTEIALHCRQSNVNTTKVNGCLCASTHLDPLEEVVHDNYRDAETFDICYRAKLWASAQNDAGELRIEVPSHAKKIPVLPPELPDTAPPAARARWKETARLIHKSRMMAERREAKRKQGIASGSRAAFAPRSPELSALSPAYPPPMSPFDSPLVGAFGGGGGGTMGMDYADSSDDEGEGGGQDHGEVKSATMDAHRNMKREENARVVCVEVEWELESPRSGIVFKTVRDGFSADQMYTTYSHAPVDMDGPRCWFPCLDHASLLISYDVTVTVPSPKIQAAFNGKILETNSIPDEDGVRWTRYRFATETLTAARAVGLAVGRFAAWDVPQSPRVKGLVLRAPSNSSKAENRRAIDNSLSAAAGGLLAHVPAAMSFLEEWLKADYPFKRCTLVFVEGLPDVYAPFGSLCLVKAELLCTAEDRIPDGDVPGDARLSVVECLLYGWVSTALRLEGGKHRWLVHGIAGYLLTQFAAELRGEEERQHRLWCAVQKAVALDCELGCPSVSPPTPDLYILDAIDPATAYYSRLKAGLILHMIEVKLQPADLQDSLGQLMRPIALHVREEDINLRRQTSSFSLARQSSSASSQEPLARQSSVASSVGSAASGAAAPGARAGAVGGGGVAGAGGGGAGVEEIEGHFMQSLTAMDFMQLVRTVAARGGHDLGKDLTEAFYQQWVTGQCIPYLRVGYHYKKKANVINLVVEQVVPPWMGGIACHGSFTVEVWEADSLGGGNGPRRSREQLPLSRDEKKSVMHVETITRPVQSKSRRRRRPASAATRNSSPVPSFVPNTNSMGAGGGPASGPVSSGGGGAGEGGAGGGASMVSGGGGGRRGVGGEEEEEEEVDPERQAMFQAQDANLCPVLWVKVDPQLEWLMSVRMRKPWHQWVEQLFSDESVEAQCDALRGLVELPLPFEVRGSELPVQAIAEAVRGRIAHTQMEHASCVRKEAAVSLALWQNQHAPPHAGGFGESKEARAHRWRGLYHLLQAFGERFEQRDSKTARSGLGLGLGGSGSGGGRNSALLLPNWFEDAAEYRLKKALIWAAANMRARDGCTPLESLDLLVTLLRENDNCENSLSDDYYVAQVLTALGQICSTVEAGLPDAAVAEAISQARIWVDLDMLGLVTGLSERAATRKTKSHNGVVAACALQCLCQLELLRGGRPEVDYEAFTKRGHPAPVRIAAVQSMIQLYLAYDIGIVEGEKDNAEGLSAALLWVLDFVEAEQFAGDTRPRYWAVRCLLDALERRPLVAAHWARFQTDDSLLGECDPWAGMEFHTPLGPGRAAYRPDGPLPKEFPRAGEAAERLWTLMSTGTAFDQGLRHLCFQLWRNLWGLETPPSLVGSSKQKTEGWRERLVIGDSKGTSKDKRRRVQMAIDGMVEKVKGWVMSRYRRRDWVNRDWVAWYYRDRERQARQALKRKGEEEEEDITAIPWDGQYGPEPPKDAGDGEGLGGDLRVHHWEEGAVGGSLGGGDEGSAKKTKIVFRTVVGGGGSG